MFTRYILSNMKRSAVTNLLFCLLLMLAGALFALSAGLWYSVYRSEKNLDEIVTTIAVPDIFAIRRYVRSMANSDDLSQFTDDLGQTLKSHRETYGIPEQYRAFVTPHINRHVMNQIASTVYRSDLIRMDDRRVYGAYADGVRSVPFTIGTIADHSVYDIFVESSPQSIAAFIVTCTDVEEVFQWHWTENGRSLRRAIVADFRTEQDLFVHHGRRQTQTVTGYFPYMNPDGSFPVEEGKRYVIVGYNYSQGGGMFADNPDWYDALPQNRNMPMALYMDTLGKEHEQVEAYVAHSLGDISENIRPLMGIAGVTARSYPMSIYDRIPVFDPSIGYEGYTWFGITGSIEDALDSEQGESISAALSVAGISYNSLTVLTTTDLNSILRFNQRENRITSGRGINRRDVESGARVCVISGHLAETNNLSVGDTITMQLYLTTLGQIMTNIGTTAWIPNPYHPGLELTEPLEYRIIGIYSGARQEMNDHAVSANTVIIPSTSFDGIQGEPVVRIDNQYDPPLLDAVLVPNDKLEETKAVIDSISEGYSDFFRFYDQGYSTFKPVLTNLRFGMTWITLLSAAGWIIAVSMFSLFYVARKTNEAALLSAIGVSRIRSFRWIFSQCAIITVVAQGIVVTATAMLFGRILETAISIAVTFTESYRDFSLSEMNIAGGMQISLPLDTTVYGLVIASAAMTALVLILSAIISARMAKHASLMRKGG